MIWCDRPIDQYYWYQVTHPKKKSHSLHFGFVVLVIDVVRLVWYADWQISSEDGIVKKLVCMELRLRLNIWVRSLLLGKNYRQAENETNGRKLCPVTERRCKQQNKKNCGILQTGGSSIKWPCCRLDGCVNNVTFYYLFFFTPPTLCWAYSDLWSSSAPAYYEPPWITNCWKYNFLIFYGL